MIFAANGDRLEISYENGVVNGKATIKGKRGNKYVCNPNYNSVNKNNYKKIKQCQNTNFLLHFRL